MSTSIQPRFAIRAALATTLAIVGIGVLPAADGAAKPVKTFSLDTSSFSYPEGAERDLTVQRSNSNGKASVTVSTSPGTATSDVDYVAVNRTLTFRSGQSSILVHLSILDDAAGEGDETFSVNLSSPSKGYTLASPSSAAGTIQDEAAPTTAPATVTADSTANQIDLSWDDIGADDYAVLRATVTGGPYTQVATTTGTSFSDTGLNYGTTYYYVVEGRNDGHAGPDSAEASATTFTLLDNLEGTTSGWTATGLWHLANSSSCPTASSATQASASNSPTHAFYYGRDIFCDYNTGATNSGTLTSPNYTISGSETSVAFAYLLATEQGCPNFDSTLVEVSYDNGANWATPSGGTCLSEPGDWISYALPIAPTGTTLRVRFTFDSGDAASNDFLGWMVDDISVG